MNTETMYDLIDACDKENIGDLKRIGYYGGYGFQYKNIVFRLSEMGENNSKLFTIILYKNQEIEDFEKDDHLTVYGLNTNGKCEWLCVGGFSWENYISNYFNRIENELKDKKLGLTKEIKQQINSQEQAYRRKLVEYDKLFR